MNLYIVICLAIAGGVVFAALKNNALSWVIAGAVALSLLLGVPEISGPFNDLAQGFASVITGVVGDIG